MNTREEKLLDARIIPPVKELRLVSEDLFRLEDGCRFTVRGGEAAEVMADVRRAWGIEPEITVLPPEASLKDEAYRIEITAGEVSIAASAPAGVRHAMKTLRQLAESERGSLKCSYHILPSVRIEDEPALGFRGIHLCWFPETPVWEIEKQLRLAAYYKFNYVVIESWGVVKLESHPEFIWSEFAVERDEVKRLVALGEELGITIFPQVNLFGHATVSRTGSGKHALLDFHPEYAPLFEPDGWTWCISNPETRHYLTDIVIEIHELFGNPPFFHIGCDEAYNAGSCTSCRRADYPALLREHMLYFHDLLKQRGARALMWHDMLLSRGDERWKNYIALAQKDDRPEELLQALPRDVIICDWQYGYPEIEGKEPEWPTMKFFKESGFEVLVCPWLNKSGIRSLGRLAGIEGLAGMLETTWNLNREQNMWTIFTTSARSAWAPFNEESPNMCYHEFFNRHLREVGHDMGIDRYIQTGRVQYQVNPHDYQP